MPGSTEYIFFSLADFDKTEDELGTYPGKWLFLLKHSESFDEIPKSFLTDSTFETFFEASNRAGYSIEDEEQYTTAMMNQMDIENSKNWACKKAIAEGEAKGRVESRKEIARKLSQMGMDITAIAEATGLSETEIKTL